MGNNYEKWGAEQRKKWNAYNKSYDKAHFKSINLKLRIKEDQDIIDYLNSNGGTNKSELIRQIIREKIANSKK